MADVNQRTIPTRKDAGATGAAGPAGPTGPAGATGATGATGPVGPTPVEFNATLNSDVVIGQPVYIIDPTGNADLAIAVVDSTGGFSTAISVAVAKIDETTGNVGTFVAGTILDQSDWTSVIGSTNLSPGKDYFLDPSTAGMLTTTAPTAEGEVVTRVGRAATTTKLIVDIEAPIVL